MEASTVQSPRTRSGRKLEQVIAAAARLFREHGFGATSMDLVASEAIVSKATLYAYFSGKRELFAAVIAAEDDRHSRSLLADPGADEDFPEILLRVGRTIQDLLLAPETVSSYRMVVGEASRFPELGRDYYAHGAGQLLGRLEEFFANAMADGQLRAGHPRRAAEQFVGLVRGDLMLRALLGVDERLSAAQKDSVLRAGVDAFRRAYQPDAPPASA